MLSPLLCPRLSSRPLALSTSPLSLPSHTLALCSPLSHCFLALHSPLIHCSLGLQSLLFYCSLFHALHSLLFILSSMLSALRSPALRSFIALPALSLVSSLSGPLTWGSLWLLPSGSLWLLPSGSLWRSPSYYLWLSLSCSLWHSRSYSRPLPLCLSSLTFLLSVFYSTLCSLPFTQLSALCSSMIKWISFILECIIQIKIR